MAPVRSEFYEYGFSPDSIRKTREKLGLSQAGFARLLDIPPNTLSRWESGATAPDARSLAAIYSLAKEGGHTPRFFTRKPSFSTAQDTRTRLLLAWDYQNLGLRAKYLEDSWDYMRRYIGLLHPGSLGNSTFRAYIDPDRTEAGDLLRKLGFDVREGSFDADLQLVKDSLDDCREAPKEWVFILIADSGGYAQLFTDMRSAGVEAYLWGSEKCDEKLIDAVKPDNFVNWDRPDVVVRCLDVIENLDGKAVERSYFNHLCKEALDAEEIYPDDVGFSRKNPYGSLLRWLVAKGIVTVREIGGRSDKIAITIQD